jgi:hypothetical protein
VSLPEALASSAAGLEGGCVSGAAAVVALAGSE